MQPSTAQARVIVDELARAGVRHIVVCPGSRNAPLSIAVHEAAVAGRLTLHVRIDERTAGFLALGLAKGMALAAPPNDLAHPTGLAAVLCTSGTAVANLHPAVLEAHHAGVPLLVLTADRPAELLGTGANQTVDQRGVFGPAAQVVDFPLAERRVGGNAVWRGTVCRAVALAEAGGPVQVNIPFREPLVSSPTEPEDWPEPLTGRPENHPWTSHHPPAKVDKSPQIQPSQRTLMVIGDDHSARIVAAAGVAAKAGWPVIAEPTAVAAALAGGVEVLASGSLLINSPAPIPAELKPETLVVVGRPTLSRGVGQLMRETPLVYLVGNRPDDPNGWTDPQHTASAALGWLSVDGVRLAPPDPTWLADWQRADRAAGLAVNTALAAQPWPTGVRLARDLVDALPADSVLLLGSSNPIRFVDLVGRPRLDVRIVANRGVAGIDGSVSTAAGVALASAGNPGQHTYALLGDLTFLHDLNGLLIGPAEPRPNLTIVVLNDDGGGIFSLLEQGAPEHAAGFERVFGTPHGADLAALCAGYGVPHRLIADPAELRVALRPAPGPRVLEVRTDRAGLRDAQGQLRGAVQDAVRAELARGR